MNNVCIILARARSKRIKKKNIKKFYGKPIIYWPIQAAKKSKCFSKIIVSSDSRKILEITKKFGASDNGLRPKKLSGDKVPMDTVIKYEIFRENEIQKIDNVCCLVATAPLINHLDLKKSFNILQKNTIDYVFSASAYDAPIDRHFYINEKGFLIHRKMKNLSKGSQELERAYHDAGQFYWASYSTFSSKKNIYNGKSIAYYIPSYKSVDINTLEDWKKAEALFGILKRF